MIATLAFAPVLPWPVIALLVVPALVLVAAAAVRGARGWPWRALAVLVIGAGLLNPAIVREDRIARPDIALVVVDDSASQAVAGRAGTRDAAVSGLLAGLAGLPDVEVATVRAGEAGDPDSGTPLFTALDRALIDIPAARLAAVIMVTDGQVDDVPEDPAVVPAPLHVLLTGAPGERDRRIVVDQAPAFGLVGEVVDVVVRVEDVGDAGGDAGGEVSPVTVRARVDGGDAGALPVRPGTPETFGIRLDHAGPTVVELEVEPGPDEVSAINNRTVIAVNGVRDRLRVLLVSGQPHPGERTWRNLLKSDPAVDLVHFTILRPPDKDDAATIDELSLIAFPVEELFEEKLYDFDLVIFDRYVLRGVLPWRYLERTAAYLAEGGALLLAVGPEFASPISLHRTPLGAVMPAAPTGRIVEQAFRPLVTDLGQRHPVTSALPGESVVGSAVEGGEGPQWGRWFRLIEAEAQSGDVLMTGPGQRPLLVVDRVGDGRVAQLLSDQLWLWARGYDGGGPDGELLRRLVHWLMQEPELEEERLTAAIDGPDLVVQRRSLSPEPATARVTAPDGTERELVLEPGPDGLARAETAADQPGLWRVDDGSRTALAASGPLNVAELADLRATTETLAPVAAATGGSVSWLSDGVPDLRRVREGRDAAGDGWIGLVRRDSAVVTGVERAPLLPPLAFLALALGFMAMAWWREGR